MGWSVLRASVLAAALSFSLTIGLAPGAAPTVAHAQSASDAVKDQLLADLNRFNLGGLPVSNIQSADGVTSADIVINGNTLAIEVSKDANGQAKGSVTTTGVKLTDLIDTPGLPGIDDVGLISIEFTQRQWLLHGTFKGQNGYIYVQKNPNPGGGHYIAAYLYEMNLGDVIPGASGTPLDDISFSNLVLFYNPTGGDIPWQNAFISGDAAPWIEQSHPDGITIHKGVNVFGFVHVQPGGVVKDLLEKVNVSEVKLPMNGHISKDLLHGNPGGDLKKEILDALNMKIAVPGISIPDVPGDINIQNTFLSIAGDGDAGSVDVDIAGVLDTTVNNKQVDFDFDLDIVVQSGKDVLTFTGAETAGSTLTVPFLTPITLTNLTFKADNASSAGWTTAVSGDAQINGNDFHVSYEKAPGQSYQAEIDPKGVTLADLIDSPGMPGLDDVVPTSISLFETYADIKMQVKGIASTVMIYEHPGVSKRMVAFLTGNFSPASVIPGAANTPLKDAQLNGLTLIYNPASGPVQFDANNVPSVGSWLQNIAKVQSPSLKPGLNVFGALVVQPQGEMKSLLSKLGVTDVNIPLRGALSPKTFSSSASAIKSELLGALDIELDIPGIDIPGVPGDVNVKNTHLSVIGDADKGAVDIKVGGDMDMTIAGKTVDFDFVIDTVVQSGRNVMTIMAKETQSSTITVKALETFEITNLALEMDNKIGEWIVRVSGDSTVNGNEIDVTYIHNPNQATTLYVTTKNLTVGKLVGGQSLPGIDDVALDEIVYVGEHNYLPAHIKVTGTVEGISTKMQVQGAWGGGPGHFVIVEMGDFNLGQAIPKASGTPLDDVSFSNLVLAYSPETVPGQLSQSGIIADAHDWIQKSQSNPWIRSGMNVFGHMTVQTGGELKDVLDKVGITDVTFPLNGRIGKELLHGNPTGAIEDAILSALDIHMPIPTPNVPGVDDVMTFSDASLRIVGTLPDGSAGIDAAVSAKTTVGIGPNDHAFTLDIEYETPQGGGTKELIISGISDGDWNKPFGISWIDLKQLGVTATEKTTDGTTDWEYVISAKTDIGSHSNLDISIDAKKENGRFTGTEVSLTGPLDLSEIPGIQDIPEVNDLSITSVSVSTHGVDAKTTFQGAETDFFAFEAGSDWIVAFAQKDFYITELVTPLASTPLSGLKLSEAAVVLAENGLNGTISSFGPVAQDAFSTVYGQGADDEINLGQGINLISSFNHTNSTGLVGTGLGRLGLKEETVVLVGDIGGILGNSTPHVNLTATFSGHGTPTNMPSGSSVTPSAEVVFSVIATESGDDFDIEIGVGVDVDMTIKDDELVWGGKLGLEFEEEKVDVKFVMSLKTADLSDGGTTDYGLNCALTNTATFKPAPGPAGWDQPFGIPGFALYDVIMDLGIDADGAVHLGFAGGAKIGGDRFCVAADADLLPEAGGFPQDIAFEGAADTVDPEFLQDLAVQVAQDLLERSSATAQAGQIVSDLNTIDKALEGLPQPEFKDVAFAFVTPGATDPDLNIQGEGVALRGKVSWLGKILGYVDMAVGPTTGLKVDGGIGDLNADGTTGDLIVGPLAIKDTHMNFQVPIPPKNPLDGYFKLHGDVEIPAIDLTDTVDIDITSQKMTFSSTQTLFADFSDTITLALTGVDLSFTHPPMTDADFAISGAIQADFGTFIKTAMKTTLNTLFSDLDAFYQAGLTKVKNAQDKVDDLNKQIQAERAKVRAEQEKVEAKVEAAKQKVDDLQGDIDHAWHKYHHCHWYNAAWCKPRWALTIAGEKVAKAVADAVLDAFEKLVEHFPIDMDPRVWSLIAAKDTAMGVLDVAKYAIEGLESIDGFLQKGLDSVENFAGGSVNLNQASFNIDLSDAIAGKPADLYVDLELFGTDFSDTFALNLSDVEDELANLGTDAAQDAAHLSVMAYVGVYHMFDKVLDDIPSIFKRQLSHHLGEKLGAAQAAAKADVEANQATFEQYAQTATALQSTISTFSNTFAESVLAAPPPNPLDKEPASQTWTDEQIEIGRSGLCLGGRSWQNGGAFDSCLPDADDDQIKQRVSTETVNWASGKDQGKDSGYVKVKKDGSCLSVSGTWKTGEVDYGSSTQSKMVWTTYFTVETETATPYGTPWWGACGDTEEYHWKILEHGDGFYQFHNRATQTCMWMDIWEDKWGNINEQLEMIPCAGARTQVFRLAPTGVQAVLHTVGLPLVRAMQLSGSVGDPSAGNMDCVGTTNAPHSGVGVTGYGDCSKPYNASDGNTQNGYDTYDYYTDGLDRRRYKSTREQNHCLEYVGPPNLAVMATDTMFRSHTCQSDDVDEWMVVTPVIGGLRFQTASLQTALTVADTLADPMLVFVQPLNPNAGATWKSTQGGNAGATSSTWNVAYTAAEQSSSAIQARASAWKTIKTALDGKSGDLSKGKRACVTSGTKTLCYLLAPPTGYVPDPTDTTKTKLALPDLQGFTNNGVTQASIIDDDLGMALKGVLPNVTPAMEPAWNICRGAGSAGSGGGPDVYHMPGVIKNSSDCYYAIGGLKVKDAFGGNQVLDKQTDLFWQPAGAGYMPATAFPTGRYTFDHTHKVFVGMLSGQWTGPFDNKAVFTCRAMVGRTTRIGWTAAGRYCHIIDGTGGAVVEHFEVLTLNGTVAAPPPPPSDKCTKQDVQNYHSNQIYTPACTTAMYNAQNPTCEQLEWNIFNQLQGGC